MYVKEVGLSNTAYYVMGNYHSVLKRAEQHALKYRGLLHLVAHCKAVVAPACLASSNSVDTFLHVLELDDRSPLCSICQTITNN